MLKLLDKEGKDITESRQFCGRPGCLGEPWCTAWCICKETTMAEEERTAQEPVELAGNWSGDMEDELNHIMLELSQRSTLLPAPPLRFTPAPPLILAPLSPTSQNIATSINSSLNCNSIQNVAPSRQNVALSSINSYLPLPTSPQQVHALLLHLPTRRC